MFWEYEEDIFLNCLQNPLISIIIPVYNTCDFLEDCLCSVLAQTYHNVEVILIDDGSTDGSSAICDKFADLDRRIKVIHTSNQGVASARLTALEHSTGEYYTFVDSDDCLAPDAIRVMWDAMNSHEVDLVVCQAFRICGNDIVAHQKRPNIGYYSRKDIDALLRSNAIFDMTTGIAGYPFEICGKLYKKGFVETLLLRGQTLWYAEDMVGGLQLLYDISSMYVLDNPLYGYRVREGQATQMYKPDLLGNDTRLFNLFKEIDTKGYLKNQIPQRALMELMRVLGVAAKEFNRSKDFLTLFKTAIEFYPVWSGTDEYPKVVGLKNQIKLFLIKYKLAYIYYAMIKFKN